MCEIVITMLIIEALFIIEKIIIKATKNKNNSKAQLMEAFNIFSATYTLSVGQTIPVFFTIYDDDSVTLKYYDDVKTTEAHDNLIRYKEKFKAACAYLQSLETIKQNMNFKLAQHKADIAFCKQILSGKQYCDLYNAIALNGEENDHKVTDTDKIQLAAAKIIHDKDIAHYTALIAVMNRYRSSSY